MISNNAYWHTSLIWFISGIIFAATGVTSWSLVLMTIFLIPLFRISLMLSQDIVDVKEQQTEKDLLRRKSVNFELEKLE